MNLIEKSILNETKENQKGINFENAFTYSGEYSLKGKDHKIEVYAI